MDRDRLLNVKEAAQFLGVLEKDIKDFVQKGQLTAYQVGGMYLRFKLEQLKGFKYGKPKGPQHKSATFSDGIRDFFYFNNFYIIAVLVIAALLFIILKNIT